MKITKTNVTISAAAFALLTLVTAPAHAALITFQPALQTVSAGSAVDVVVVISDLGAGGAPSLSTFDLEITFNDDVLSFIGATFGDPILGDQLDLGGFGTITSVIDAPGLVTLFELSFDLPDDLDSLQADSFILAILRFTATGAGFSPLGITVAALGDATGDSIPSELAGGGIEVTGRSVPEPAVLVLLLSGLAAVATRRAQNQGVLRRR